MVIISTALYFWRASTQMVENKNLELSTLEIILPIEN